MGETSLSVIALAEEDEEIFLPGKSHSLRLPFESPGLQILQNLRDEAHRFAVTYHRRLRGQGQTASALDEAPGIGPARRNSLLKSFGSLQAIRQAAPEELAVAPGMNKAAAARLYAWLREERLTLKDDR
jgi:excinuclease ABC subunit C